MILAEKLSVIPKAKNKFAFDIFSQANQFVFFVSTIQLEKHTPNLSKRVLFYSCWYYLCVIGAIDKSFFELINRANDIDVIYFDEIRIR